MARIALCFTGHVRSLRQRYKNLLDNIIDKSGAHTYTIYYVTWASEPIETIRECLPDAQIITVPDINENNAEFLEWAPQVNMHISWRRTYPDITKCKFRYFAQFFLLREAARRIELGNYDVVVRCRPDIQLNSPIYQYFSNIDNRTAYFSNETRHGGFEKEEEGCQCAFSWGGAQSMRAVFSVLDGTLKYRHSYIDEQTGEQEQNVIHDESILYKYLLGEGYKIEYINYSYKIMRTQLEGNSEDHLQFFIEKIERQEPFALIRPNDGEYMVLQDERFTNIDNWTFSGGSLREELELSIHFASRTHNSYVGIPCPDCWTQEKTDWYINKFAINDAHLTYGNIVCNKNWQTLMDYLHKNQVAINYIGPGTNSSTYINVVSQHTISPYLLNNWDALKDATIREVNSYVSSRISATSSWQIFCFSAGPIAKILIPYLFMKYPNHIFIDVGSAFDPIFKGCSNRGYMIPGSDLAGLVCDFKSGHKSHLGNE